MSKSRNDPPLLRTASRSDASLNGLAFIGKSLPTAPVHASILCRVLTSSSSTSCAICRLARLGALLIHLLSKLYEPTSVRITTIGARSPAVAGRVSGQSQAPVPGLSLREAGGAPSRRPQVSHGHQGADADPNGAEPTLVAGLRLRPDVGRSVNRSGISGGCFA